MPPPQSTSDLYATLQEYQLLLTLAGRRLWSRMLPGDFDRSWSQIGPSLVSLTSGAQLAAARAAVDYVPIVLEETNQPDRPEALIRPRAFAGVASDGRSLAGLLEGAKVRAKEATKTRVVRDVEFGTLTTIRGLDGGDALALGEKWLEQALQTAVADAMRDATAASVAVRPGLGWVRIASPPCCSRCAVLAGTFYRWNEPNRRHPGCDCLTQPVTEKDSDQYLTNAADLLKRGQITDLSSNQRKRLDEGANLNKVLNESRDRWRERMAADRKAAKDTWGGTPTSMPPGGVQDFLSHLTNRVEALKGLRAAGIAD